MTGGEAKTSSGMGDGGGVGGYHDHTILVILGKGTTLRFPIIAHDGGKGGFWKCFISNNVVFASPPAFLQQDFPVNL